MSCAPEGNSPDIDTLGGWGPVDDDLVGTASARLLAIGVSPRGRSTALRLLGLLGDHAGADGRIRMPLHLLVQEFELDPDDAAGAVEALEAVEIVSTHDGVVTLAGREPDRPGGLRLADFLRLADAPDEEAEPEPVALAEPAVVAPPRPPASARPRPRAALAFAALCLLLAVALTPGAHPRSVTTRLAGADAPTVEIEPPNAEASLGDAVVDIAPAPGVASGPAAAAPSRPAGPSAAETDRAVPPALGDLPRLQLPPLVALPDLDLPKPKLALCPAGTPVLEVVGRESHVGPGSEDEGDEERWFVVVRGTLTNPADVAVTVDRVDVRIGDGDTVAVFTEPRTIRPGAEQSWTATVVTGTVAPVVEAITTELGAWRWADPGIAQACPVA